MLKSVERERDKEMKWVSLSLGIAHYLKLICVRERVLICMRERVREWIRRVAVKFNKKPLFETESLRLGFHVVHHITASEDFHVDARGKSSL